MVFGAWQAFSRRAATDPLAGIRPWAAAGFALTAVWMPVFSQQLFWLAAMPGLAGGTLRLVHMFLTPMFGTRLVVSLSTLSLLIPLVGWFYAVQDPGTP